MGDERKEINRGNFVFKRKMQSLSIKTTVVSAMELENNGAPDSRILKRLFSFDI